MSSTFFDAFGTPAGKNSAKAAFLSLIPGLGQLYNGEKRKGILFLDATIVNVLLLLLIVFNQPTVGAITEMCQHFHVKANVSVLDAVRCAHFGSPASVVLFTLMGLFVAYAVIDAYFFDVRTAKQMKIKYPSQLIGLTETSSGVYLAHFALLMACLIGAACFSGKRPIERNYTVIEFIPEQAETALKPPVDTTRQSERDSIDSGRHDDWRDIIAPESASDPVAPSTASAAAPNPNETRPQPAIDPIPGAPQPNLRQLAAMTTPTLATTPVPSKLSASRPMAGDPNPKQATAAPVQYISGTQSNPTPQAVRPTTAKSENMAPDGATSAGSTPDVVKNPTTPSKGGTVAAPGMVATLKHPSSVDTATPVAVLAGGSPSGTSRSDTSPMPTVQPGHGTTMTGENDNVIAPVSNDRGVLGNTNPNAVDGPDSVASVAVNPDFSAYMNQLQRIIKKHWYPPRDGSSNASVIFELRKDGSMNDLRISQTSNNNTVDAAALTAIRNAQPYFPVLPKSAPDAVDIEFTFEYNNMVRTWKGENQY